MVSVVDAKGTPGMDRIGIWQTGRTGKMKDQEDGKG